MANCHEPMTCMNKTTSDPFRWQKILNKAKIYMCYLNQEYIFFMLKKILRIHKITNLTNCPNLTMMWKKNAKNNP